METVILIEGELEVGEADVLRFHPGLAGLLEEIKARGWSYRFARTRGRARVVVDPDRLQFSLEYHSPDLAEPGDEGFYEIKAEVGRRPPGIVEIDSIDKVILDVSPGSSLWSVEVDPINGVITHVPDVLWGLRRGREGRLHEARGVYEAAKFFLEEKGYRLKDSYTVERYKELVDLFEKPYKFTLTVELTVHKEEQVPSWDDLVNQLAGFFRERGLLAQVKYEGGGKGLLGLRKPIP